MCVCRQSTFTNVSSRSVTYTYASLAKFFIHIKEVNIPFCFFGFAFQKRFEETEPITQVTQQPGCSSRFECNFDSNSSKFKGKNDADLLHVNVCYAFFGCLSNFNSLDCQNFVRFCL